MFLRCRLAAICLLLIVSGWNPVRVTHAAEPLSLESTAILEHLEALWEGMKSDIVSSDLDTNSTCGFSPKGSGLAIGCWRS